MLKPGYAAVVPLVVGRSGHPTLPDGRPLTPDLGFIIWSAVPVLLGSPVVAVLSEPIRVEELLNHNARVVAQLATELEPADEPYIVSPPSTN